MMFGVETQMGRSWRTEPLSRVRSWKSTVDRYVAGSDASSVVAARSTAGADHTLRFMSGHAPCWPCAIVREALQTSNKKYAGGGRNGSAAGYLARPEQKTPCW